MDYRVKIIDENLTWEEQEALLDAILDGTPPVEQNAVAFLADNTAIISQPGDSVRYTGGAA